jgi:hypothetical protein
LLKSGEALLEGFKNESVGVQLQTLDQLNQLYKLYEGIVADCFSVNNASFKNKFFSSFYLLINRVYKDEHKLNLA